MAPSITFFVLIASALLASQPLASGVHGLKLQRVDRKINIASQVVYITDALKISNDGSQDVQEVVLCTPGNYEQHLAYLEVTQGQKDAVEHLMVEPSARDNLQAANVSCHSVRLAKPLAPGAKLDMNAAAAYTKLLTPKPSSIAQNEPQRVVWQGTAQIISPYEVETQTTQVRLPSRKVDSFTKVAPSAQSDTRITYGPYKATPPFSATAVAVHYENNSPFAVVTSLDREIQVSHWGNIYVEETYSLAHTGAKLKGTWSRLDYQTNPNQFGASSFRMLTALLPAQANTLYFRDEIGNISSSHVRFGYDKVEALLEPRYPLFGGWKVNFVFGYSLPLRDYVSSRKGGRRQLVQRFGSPLMGVVVDDIKVKVVLPEGATNIKATLPFAATQSTDVKYTYLDTTGRPVLVLNKQNVVAEHNLPYSIEYDFSTIAMLREPLMLTTAFALFFVTVMLGSRIDLTLNKSSGWRAHQDKQKASTLVQQLASIVAERRRLYTEAAAGGVKQAPEGPLKTSLSKLREIAAELEGAPGPSASIRDLVEREKALQALVLQYSLRRGQASSSASPDTVKKLTQQEKAITDAKKEITALIDSLLDTY